MNRIPSGFFQHPPNEQGCFPELLQLAQLQIQVVMHSIPQSSTAQLQSAGRPV